MTLTIALRAHLDDSGQPPPSNSSTELYLQRGFLSVMYLHRSVAEPSLAKVAEAIPEPREPNSPHLACPCLLRTSSNPERGRGGSEDVKSALSRLASGGPGELAHWQEFTAVFSEPAIEVQSSHCLFPNANAFYKPCCPSDRKVLL